MLKRIKMAIAALVVGVSASGAAFADGMPKSYAPQTSDPFANFQIKVGATGVFWNNHNDGIYANGSLVPSYDAAVGNVWLPTATLTYFFNPKLSAELFCCFAHVKVAGKNGLDGVDLANTWAFPPIVTLKYHFDKVGGIRPYVGAGVQYIHYFSSKSDLAGYDSVSFKDSWGAVLQGGFDLELGRGWSVGLDAKYVWEKTDLTFTGGGNTITTSHQLDPLLVTVNLGYRFNLEDMFGRRASYEPLK
ncbi:MAG: OmpW family outer membrane protein [Hyphomicrobiaceae bacterium]|nr:OmpW family outer membrane protein [Hyphomicrobiaceae bacterium]